MYFNKKLISYCIFEKNIFIEMVICVAVDCKKDSRQGKAKVFIIFKGRKSETAMVHKNKTLKCLGFFKVLYNLGHIIEI